MTKISSVYRSKLPYQWEAGSYNGISHATAPGVVRPNGQICMYIYCHHPKYDHNKSIGCKRCACAEFRSVV
jgi:hypothetical protein